MKGTLVYREGHSTEEIYSEEEGTVEQLQELLDYIDGKRECDCCRPVIILESGGRIEPTE